MTQPIKPRHICVNCTNHFLCEMNDHRCKVLGGTPGVISPVTGEKSKHFYALCERVNKDGVCYKYNEVEVLNA